MINQATYNENLKQHESLLHTDQARFHRVKINDFASCFKDGHGNVEKQSLETEGWSIPLLHDRSKYYLKTWEPTEKTMDLYPIIELTSPMPWDIQTQLSSLRQAKRKLDKFSIEDIETWSERLRQIPTFIAKKTLEVTTQLVNTVEAETRTMPHQHFKVKTPSLRPRQCQEGFHSDTFFSDTRSTIEALNADRSLWELKVPTPVLI